MNASEIVNTLMNKILLEITTKTNWYDWVEYINKRSDYIEEFKLEMSCISDDTVRQIYKHFRNHAPIIYFIHITKEFKLYYRRQKKQTIKITATKMDINLIRELLAYSILVEASVPQYKKRINEHFGFC